MEIQDFIPIFLLLVDDGYFTAPIALYKYLCWGFDSNSQSVRLESDEVICCARLWANSEQEQSERSKTSPACECPNIVQTFFNISTISIIHTIKEQIIDECLTQSLAVWRIEMTGLPLSNCGVERLGTRMAHRSVWRVERKWIEFSKQNIRLNLENFSINSIIVENGN